MGKRNTPKINKPMLLRCGIVVSAFVLAAGWLTYTLFQLQVEQASEWQARASGQQLANIPIAPQRGVIYDSELRPMAESATVWTVEAAPDVLAKNKALNKWNDKGELTDNVAARTASKELAKILDLDYEELYEKLNQPEKKYYKVKAKIDKPLADEVREMCKEQNLGGIILTRDSKRFYPYEELAATVLGFTNADGNGVEGIESYYDELLAGTPGRQVAVRTATGGEVATGDESTTHPAEDGKSIVLTINTDIQQLTEKYLTEAVNQHIAKERGMAIVMDVNTGAILAMAVCPSYNPNEPYEIFDETTRLAVEEMPDGDDKVTAEGAARTKQWRNKALADTYEPGSVLKVITAAAAIDSGAYNINSGFNCSSKITVADREFNCAQGNAHGAVSLEKALIESCNVSFVTMGLGMGAHTWHDYINAFGLTEPTGVDLPGEPNLSAISNLVYSEEQLGPVQLASCSFGQSNKYTAMQMITAVSAAVNGGNLVQPHVVSQVMDSAGNVVENVEPPVKRQVISPETSAELRASLEKLVSDTPNGRNAYVAGFHVGGKSGTSQKLEILTQENRQEYISSFCGFAPADDPKIAVLVVLDEPEDPEAPGPERTYFGGRLAGPAAGRIIDESLRILGYSPSYEEGEELGRTTMTCPGVVEKRTIDAQTTLSKEGLTGMVLGSGERVVAQYPAAHTQVPTGGLVILYSEEGEMETVKVPDLTGKDTKQASDMLHSMGLNTLLEGAPGSGDTVKVIGQSIEPETEVPKGEVITLTLQDTSNVAE